MGIVVMELSLPVRDVDSVKYRRAEEASKRDLAQSAT